MTTGKYHTTGEMLTLSQELEVTWEIADRLVCGCRRGRWWCHSLL